MHIKVYIGRDRAKLLDLAARVGVSPATVYRYMAGTRIPRPDHMRAIERETAGAVTAADFYAHGAPQEAA
jgi:DNA-binding transcriptional regulator YdaS (Cro superfamily)